MVLDSQVTEVKEWPVGLEKFRCWFELTEKSLVPPNEGPLSKIDAGRYVFGDPTTVFSSSNSHYSLFIIIVILEPHAVLAPNVDVEVDGEELDFICDNI